MNNAIKNALIFSLGAATGSLVAWRLLKTKYERFAQNEIDSYKEYIKTKNVNEPVEKNDVEAKDDEKIEIEPIVPKDLLDRYRSSEYDKEDQKIVREPYVIPPEEYGMLDGYECRSLTYYADGVLTDEWDNVIGEPDDVVGEDFASHFGEYEDDSVFIRNEGEQCDYEILRDLNTFVNTMSPEDSEA